MRFAKESKVGEAVREHGMLINDTPPNVRRIETDREGAYAFEVKGFISAADVENMYGLLEGAYELHDRIDLIVIVHDYEGIDWSAAWKEPTIFGKTRALKHIRKYALVGGPAWFHAGVSFFKPFLSIEMKTFELEEVESAWEWIGAKPLPGPA